MRLFKTLLLLAFASSAATAAWGEVTDGSEWTGGGDDTVTVTFHATQNSLANTVSCHMTNASGADSNTVTGTPGENSTSDKPTAEETPGGGDEGFPMSVDGTDYRVEGGHMERRGSDGVWRRMSKPKKKAQQDQAERLVAGQPAPHAGTLLGTQGMVQLTAGERAPFTGWLLGS